MAVEPWPRGVVWLISPSKSVAFPGLVRARFLRGSVSSDMVLALKRDGIAGVCGV